MNEQANKKLYPRLLMMFPICHEHVQLGFQYSTFVLLLLYALSLRASALEPEFVPCQCFQLSD